MALAKLKDLLKEADKHVYAVGAFSIANMEMVMGAIKAAEELKAPIILQIAESRLSHSPLQLIGPVMIRAAEKAEVPVAVHFDHGISMEFIMEVLELGFTSVMIDGSRYPLEENIKLTRKVMHEAKKYGASVEAEIGRVGGSEDGSQKIAVQYANAEDAKRFYEETGVDALAIGIGNAHGVYRGTPKLRFDVLKSIDENVEVPLVLHGGSGISDNDFKRCVALGMRKINIATSTFMSVADSVKKLCDKYDTVDYFKLHEAEVEGAYLNIKRHIKVFGTENKA